MSQFPKITVVTPSYNQAAFIDETMASIHGQGYPNLEHIVIDGGSTDGSVEIIKRYEHHLAHWQSRPDGGQTDALIQGFERATGDILCWLNSDDLYEPQTLFEVADFFSSRPETRFAYGDASWIDQNGVFIKPKREHGFNRFVWFWDHNFIPQPSAFWRASLYREVGGLDRSFNLAMDADLWIRFAEVTAPVHSRRCWSQMRFYPEQKNTSLRSQSLAEMESIRRRYDRNAGRLGAGVRGAAARSARIALKAAAGGYPPREMLTHLGTLVGRGSWEERKMASPD
jgi:glycosyltransferase involved in cell wall biosynthesis